MKRIERVCSLRLQGIQGTQGMTALQLCNPPLFFRQSSRVEPPARSPCWLPGPGNLAVADPVALEPPCTERHLVALPPGTRPSPTPPCLERPYEPTPESLLFRAKLAIFKPMTLLRARALLVQDERDSSPTQSLTVTEEWEAIPQDWINTLILKQKY